MLVANKSERLTTSTGIPIQVCFYGQVDYLTAEAQMREFSSSRSEQDLDQIWLLQHPPVYTQGTACQQVPFSGNQIPVVKTDRGGQITYHGPGQLVMYPLLNLRRHGLGVKALVFKLEQAVIDLLATSGLQVQRREDAPGVYKDAEKIAALGLRIRRGNSYHGLSLNIDMDLDPFNHIDPCGYRGLQVTQMVNHTGPVDIDDVAAKLVRSFITQI